MNKHYYGLDFGKIIAAVLVISIHTVPLVGYKGTIIFKLWEIISNLAVPFFFVCTGYFIGQRYKEKGIQYIRFRAFSFLKIYILCTFAYLPLTIYNYLIQKKGIAYSFLHFTRGFFLYGNHGWSWQLWYLLCAFYSLILLYFLKKHHFKDISIWAISLMFFLVGAYTTYVITYQKSFYPVIITISKYVKTLFWNGRMFTGMLGLWIGMQIDKYKKSNNLILFLIATTGLALSMLLNSFSQKILCYLIVTSLFLILRDLNISNSTSKFKFGVISSYVFYIHMFFVFLFTEIPFLKVNELIRFFRVTICSLLFSYLVLFIKQRVHRDF